MVVVLTDGAVHDPVGGHEVIADYSSIVTVFMGPQDTFLVGCEPFNDQAGSVNPRTSNHACLVAIAGAEIDVVHCDDVLRYAEILTKIRAVDNIAVPNIRDRTLPCLRNTRKHARSRPPSLTRSAVSHP